MPASTSTRFTLAHAKASARLPKSVMRALTNTPTIHALRKQPNTLRDAISALRTTTAHTASRSARQLNEHLLQLRLAHAHVADGHALGEQLPQQIGQALLGVVHRTLRPAVGGRAAQHARRLSEPRRRRRLQSQRDHVAEADPTL